MKTGIEPIPFDVAKINLPMHTWSNASSVKPEKLQKRLGLLKIKLPVFTKIL